MNQKFVPLGKRSKREQREYHAARRSGWGGIDPATKKLPNARAYDRKKSGKRYEYESHPDFFIPRFSSERLPASGLSPRAAQIRVADLKSASSR